MSDQVKASAEAGYKVNDLQTAAPAPLEDSLKTLTNVGGFDFFEALIDGANNLNPAKKARVEIFKKDGDKKEQRKVLKAKMQTWLDLLAETNSVADMAGSASEKAAAAEDLLKGNLKKILKNTKELETAYRSVHLFYKNTESTSLKNVNIMNASIDQLKDLDEPDFIEHVEEELNSAFDKLDMRNNYSLMVVPGFLGSAKVVNKWAKMAYNNKVMLVTDFDNTESPDETLKDFVEGNYTSGDAYKSNAIMTCNYIVGRGKKVDVGEEDDIYVPGSAALAGKMYCTKLSQPVAGKTYGTIDEIDAVRFDQKKAAISALENAGLVPFVGEWGSVMPFSAKTLFNGDNLGLQTYSVVRVFDFVGKVVSDFLNRRTMETWNTLLEKNLRGQIVKFLDGIKGPGNLIENFTIDQFEQNEEQPDQVNINITLKPFFTAKSFLVKFEGHKGAKDWKGEVTE